MRSRFRLPALIAAAALTSLGLNGTAAAAPSRPTWSGAERPVLTAAQVRRLAAHATDRSIIIFKNQLTNLPARGATEALRVRAAEFSQAPVLAELARVHATRVTGFHIINAIAATISPAEAQRLRANPAIRAVVPDAPVRLPPLSAGPPSLPQVGKRGHYRTMGGPTQQICPSNPNDPLIEPQGLGLMNVPAANQIVDGTGIKVAVIADGIDPNNPDLIRPDGQHVIFDYQDFSGQDPNVPTVGRAGMLGVGLIASQGNQTYDLSQFVNPAHPLPAGCNIKIEGVAPGSSLAELNAFGNDRTGYNSEVIQAEQYAAMVDHVSVINEVLGGTGVPNFYNDPPALLDQALVAAGIVVVAPIGNSGTTTDGNPFSPGGVPGVIGVGATTAFQSYAQTDQNGPVLAPGGWEDNNISSASASGINEFGPRTFDVVAPGDSIFTLCATDTTAFFGCGDPFNGSSPGILDVTSTAASASEVAGVAALVQQAYAKTHDGALPPAPLVEQILESTATDLGAPGDHQGAGLVNALKAVRLAESVNSASPQGSTLLVNQTQLDATVNAGQSHTFSIGVTNEGSAPQTVTPRVSGRPSTVSTDTGTVNLSSSDPTYVDGFGATDSYAVHTFTVPAGGDYLNGDISWNAQQVGGAAYEELFDPQGNLAAYSSLSNRQSGFGQVEVRKPMAGTWTAVIYTRSILPYFGPVHYSNTTEDFHVAGSVSPASRTLAPGQSGTFHVTVTAGQAGDQALSLHMGTGSSTDGAIPIVLRALVPITSSGGSFSGTLTGDGTPAFTTAGSGQEFTYQFNVPAGEPSLNVGIKLANPGYIVEGSLIAPFDQGLDLQSAVNDAVGPGGTLQFFHRAPVPGLWAVSIVTVGPNDGSALSTPFTGTISFTPPAVTSSGIPDSPGTVLPAGHPITATITVTNTGNIAKDYFADPRLHGKEQVLLLGTALPAGVPNATTFTVPEPLPAGITPHWIVPTDTTGFIAVEQSTEPITTDINSDNNDPEEAGVSFGDNSVATAISPELAPGQEWTAPEPTCPCTAEATGTTNLTAVAITNPFDSAISTSTGDAWLQQSVNASAPYTPITLAPGQSGTITLTLTPNAPQGTVVRGFIAVDTFNHATDSGDELIHIPYRYTVG